MKKLLIMISLLAFTGRMYAETTREADLKRGMKKRRGQFRTAMESLNLTEEQKTELKKHKKENFKEQIKIRKEIKKSRKKMHEAFASNMSDSEFKKLHEKIKELKNKIADFRFKKMSILRKILTPEQRKKFTEIMKSKRNKRRMGRRSRRGTKKRREIGRRNTGKPDGMGYSEDTYDGEI